MVTKESMKFQVLERGVDHRSPVLKVTINHGATKTIYLKITLKQLVKLNYFQCFVQKSLKFLHIASFGI